MRNAEFPGTTLLTDKCRYLCFIGIPSGDNIKASKIFIVYQIMEKWINQQKKNKKKIDDYCF